MTIGEKIKSLRENKGYTQEQFAELLNTTKQAVYKYEKGIVTNIPSDKIELIAQIFDVSPAYLMGWDTPAKPTLPANITPIDEVPTKRVYTLGQIAGGQPILATPEIEIPLDMSDVDAVMRVVGDSMLPNIHNGDTVYIHLQPTVENGEVAAVAIDDEATLKRVYHYPDRDLLILRPDNPAYPEQQYTAQDGKAVRIIGKAVKVVSRV